MAHWATYPEPGILDKIIADKAATWDEGMQKFAQSDGQRVLEALLAEYGIEAAVRALDNQGYSGNAVRYLLQLLHDEAMRRRRMAHEPPRELSDEEFEAILAELDEAWEAMGGTQAGPVPELPITREEIYRDHP